MISPWSAPMLGSSYRSGCKGIDLFFLCSDIRDIARYVDIKCWRSFFLPALRFEKHFTNGSI